MRSFWRGVKQAKAMCARVHGETEESSGGDRMGTVQCLTKVVCRARFSGEFTMSHGSRWWYADEVLIIAVIAPEILRDRSDFVDDTRGLGREFGALNVAGGSCSASIWIVDGVAGREKETTRCLI